MRHMRKLIVTQVSLLAALAVATAWAPADAADGSFDAVVCVFGVFFAPDMTAFAAGMWRLVRPGGMLAITTWGPGLFEPACQHPFLGVHRRGRAAVGQGL